MNGTDRRKPCKALVGFDGYIDKIERVVKSVRPDGTKSYYDGISDFAARIGAAAGLSADFETETRTVKLGGNAPIMANALSGLGIETICIGAMGTPRILPPFRELAERCACVSVCDPAETNAIEFDDGKLMFADTGVLARGMVWDNIVDKAGLVRLRRMFGESDLIAAVNWSGIAGMDGILGGIRTDILPHIGGKRRFFFDLSDPSKKSDEEIRGVLEKMSGFGEYGEVTVGLNENEAARVFRALFEKAPESPEMACAGIFEAVLADAVVVHPVDRSIAATEKGLFVERGSVVEHPVLTTGGGDHFNAGFCAGRLAGADIRESLRLGMKVSGFYVSHGFSPEEEDIVP